MRFSVLASSSKANSTIVEFGSCRILIDCGLSAKAAEYRLSERDIDPSTISAILITHEHTDHIKGVASLSRRFKIPVYVNRATSKFLGACFHTELFKTGESFSVGKVDIHPFAIIHDAVEPVAFTLTAEGMRFGHVTDIGKITNLVRDSIQGVHALVLEANHDEEMLQYCRYPWPLKQRIASSHGHLSNRAAGELLAEIDHSDLCTVILGHISEESNRPKAALEAVLEKCVSRCPRTIKCADSEGLGFLEAA